MRLVRLLTVCTCALLAHTAFAAITLEVSAANIDENVAGATITINATRTVDTIGPVSATVDTADISTIAGSDYVAIVGGSVSWIDGEGGTKPITITINDDNDFEGNETFTVTLTNPLGTTLGAITTATITINDDESQPIISLAVSADNVDENVGGGTITINATRTGALGGAISATVDTANVTATAGAGADYLAIAGGNVNWGDGVGGNQPIIITINDDDIFEGSETFTVTISAPTGGAALGATTTATITINDDDAEPTISFQNPTPNVGESSGSVQLDVVLSNRSSAGVTVNFDTSNGTATAGTDYVANTGNNLSWPNENAALTQTITVNITPDVVFEGNETFQVTLSNPVNTTITGTNPATVTITDDDGQPTISFDAAAIDVSEDGGNAILTVGLSGPSASAISVNFATINGTAFGSDFGAPIESSPLTWPPNDASDRTITIPITDDDDFEGDETFDVNLSGPVGATITGTNPATVTILDNDTVPTISLQVANASFGEGAGAVVVNAIRSGATGGAVSATVDTANISAIAGPDYVAISGGSVSWNDGEGGAQPIALTINDDAIFEGDETFTVTITNFTGGAVPGAITQATITINDDETAPIVGFTTNAVTINETAGTVTLTVQRTGAVGDPITVDYATANGTAIAGEDYTADAGTLNWPGGDGTDRQIVISLTADNTFEGTPDETFTVTLSNEVGATLATDSVTVSLVDGDAQPSLQFSVVDFAVSESIGIVSVEVIRGGSPGGRVSVDYATVPGTATAGEDYESVAGTLTWLSGDVQSQMIDVVINDDLEFEDATPETFTIVLSNPAPPGRASLGANSIATISIADTEQPPTIGFNTTAVTVAEDLGILMVEVERVNAPGSPVTIDFQTTSVTATDGEDYTGTNGTLTWEAGNTDPQFIPVPIIDDDDFEPGSETFTVALSNPTGGAQLGPNTLLTVSIADNEALPLVGFEIIASNVNENDGSAILNVQRIGAPGGQVTLDFATADDTAVEGEDYVAQSGTITFDDGDLADKQIVIEILDDAIFETATETFSVTLSNVIGATLGPAGTHVVTIVEDDEPMAPVADAGADQTIESADGANVDVIVDGSQSSDPDDDIVGYEWSLGGAVVGTDPVLTISLGIGEFTLQLRVVDSAALESTDTVTVTIARVILDGEPLLADLAGLDATQLSVAVALDDLCPRLNVTAGLSADAEDLRGICTNVIRNDDTSQQITALDQMAAKQVTGQMTQAIEVNNFNFRNLGSRMADLRRHGARGLSTEGLSVSVGDQQLPISLVMDALSGMARAAPSATYRCWLIWDPTCEVDPRLGFFLTGSVSTGDKDQTGLETGFDFSTNGVTLGVDYQFTDNFFAGVALGFGNAETDYAQNAGTLDSNAWTLSVFGTYFRDLFYLDTMLSFGGSDYDSDRNMVFNDGTGLIDRTASGSTDGNQFSFGLEAGIDYRRGNLRLVPNVNLNYADFTIDGYDESGASGLDMSFDEQGADTMTLAVGGTASYTWELDWGVVRPEVRFDYVTEQSNDGHVINAHFLNDPFAADATTPTPGITIVTDEPDTSYMLWGIGITAQGKNGFSAFVDYQSVAGYEGMTASALRFGLRYERMLGVQ